ncbi:hypothetical protein [Alistipes ihumii]|uniref:hypothetical protein n=1 Tax=Alistipes ihumii TaxID=1470347 RepID=UPI0027B9CBC9|nr:hypothetical protein [Alistipes ihumii]
MRKFLLLFAAIACAALVGCSNPEKQAKKLVRQQLKETLHDWNSYESVKFGTLDSVYTTVFDNPEYKIMSDEFIELVNEMGSAMDDYKRYRNMGYLFASERKAAYDRMTEYNNICEPLKFKMDSIKNIFVPEFKGWSIDHSFRANNLAGHKGIHHERYYFDKEITQIVDSEDIGEDSDE